MDAGHFPQMGCPWLPKRMADAYISCSIVVIELPFKLGYGSLAFVGLTEMIVVPSEIKMPAESHAKSAVFNSFLAR